MMILNSVTFRNDETGKNINVNIPDLRISSDHSYTPDEYATCSFLAGLLLAGGIDKIEKFYNLKK